MKNKLILLGLFLINIIFVELSWLTGFILQVFIFHGFLFFLFEVSIFSQNTLKRYKINTPFVTLSVNFFRIISSAIFIIYFLNKTIIQNEMYVPYVYNFFVIYFIYLIIYTSRNNLKS